MINTREEAQRLVAYTHYAPHGHPQLRPGARAMYGGADYPTAGQPRPSSPSR
jgi:4-hydroxy-2-oxoheptanedioate aldolase